MNFAACFAAIFASIAGTILGEFLSWVLVTRTDGYKRTKARIALAEAKVAKLKAEGVAAGARKLQTAETEVTDATREATLIKTKSMVAVGASLLGIVAVLTSCFEGQPAATLPFTPFGIVTNISHRGLLGDDYREASVLFIYILASMGLRPALQKLLGTAPSRNATQTMMGPL